MKRAGLILVALTLIVGSVSGLAAAQASGLVFEDVPANKWYAEAVGIVSERGVMVGNAGKFFPGSYLSRGMAAQLFANLDGVDLSGYTKTAFTDVPKSAYYFKAVAWAEGNGIVSGRSKTIFAPNDPITRQEMAVLLCNYVEYKNISLLLIAVVADYAYMCQTFSDYPQVSVWARDAVTVMHLSDLMRGKPGKLFDPMGATTRAEAAVLIARFFAHPWILRTIDNFSP